MSETFAKKEEMTAILNELKQMRQDFEQRWLEHVQEIKALREESNRYAQEIKALREESEQRWLEFRQEIKALREASDLHTQGIKALQEASDLHTHEIKALREASDVHTHEIKALREASDVHTHEIKALREASDVHTQGIKALREASDVHTHEIKALREDFNELRTEFKVLRADVSDALRKFENIVYGLGARWGIMSEEAFRNGLAAVLTDELGFRVERYHDYDESGAVYGHPEQVELDVIIRNGLVIAIEIKSSIRRGDLSLFHRKITFYEQSENRRVDSKFVISPFIDPAAVEMSERLGIELYTHSSEITP
ncbi:DUF3782 domain-containing protein [Candidatus Poribacteria bacterium]|nr:DUF3782 domain-containing protein [Candidatus Poribacteria bacterium]